MGLTRCRTTATVALHKAVDTRRLSVTAALTYPVTDRAGDYVVPEGIDWTVHKARPWVGYEHYRVRGGEWVLPGPGDDHLPPVEVGTARHPDTGEYGVQLKSMAEGSIPFGTTYFDPSDRLSSQTFKLVEDGTLEGVSIEFTLRKGHYRELGRSPLENRPAYHVSACSGLGWVHCMTPVNPGALLLKAVPPHVEQARRVAASGKVGSEPAHPLILKSLSRFVPAGKSATVTGGFARVEKAMPDTAEMTAAYETDAPEADAAPAAKNGVEAFYDHAQQLLDLCGSMEEAMDSTDSPELIDAATKLLPKIEALAEQLKGHADKHDAKLQAKRSGKEEPADDEDAEPNMEVDDEGVLKAMRPAFYKAIKSARVKRFSKAEVAAAAVVTPTDTPEELAAARAEAEAAARVKAKALRVYG